MATDEGLPILKLKWKTDDPVWVDQWPLTKEKVVILKQLVQEQLDAGHIKPSVSPWNTPVFVIPKKSGKWRLLHDLRKINEAMCDMGPLQPGLPSPNMIPQSWEILIIDLKDCFFTIPICEEDSERFAFSIFETNKQAPMKRYQWVVLPQGMKNSPTMCQIYVDDALTIIRQRFPTIIIYHYMDDILIAGPKISQELTQALWAAFDHHKLQVAPEKVQVEAPWKYLGYKILEQTIQPQKIQIKTEIRTLNDVQQLLGNINWIRPLVGLSNQMLEPLFDLLKGDSDLNAPRRLTKRAEEALKQVENCLEQQQSFRIELGHPLKLLIINNDKQPCGLIMQWIEKDKDKLKNVEWIFLQHQPSKTIVTRVEMFAQIIMKGRRRIVELCGKEPETIIIPMVEEYLQWSLQNNAKLQVALVGFDGQIKIHRPASKIITFLEQVVIEQKMKIKPTPIQGARTVFTDGSGKTGKAVVVWKENDQWQSEIKRCSGSPQIVELEAVLVAFKKWNNEPLNIVCDSQYVTGIVMRIERAYLKHVNNELLFLLLKQLLYLLNQRPAEYYICHHRSHTNLPGFVAEGNAKADLLTQPVFVSPVPDLWRQAQLSHAFFHQSAKVLHRQFKIPQAEARAIIQACPDCQKISKTTVEAVNPRGTESLQVWQMDVTHILEFGTLKYVHVSIDTFSMAVCITPMAGEKTTHVMRHCRQAFATLGIPKQIKTDNGPAYVSHKVQQFFQKWGIQHVTGIPHSPTGQAIIERAHHTIKNYLAKQKQGELGESPINRAAKVQYVMNFLRLAGMDVVPPIVKHTQTMKSNLSELNERVNVLVRNQKGDWEGPFKLITWGRGYACVITGSGPTWIPAKWVRPATEVVHPGSG